MKSNSLFVLLFLSPFFINAQSLTGLWIGKMSNDSNTVRKEQSYEIALTEYRGKVYGYSRSEFIVNDTLFYIMKRVKGTINGNVCEVKDDEIISYNFRGKIDKGVKVTNTFLRSEADSTWSLSGTWKTNKTKNYYAVTGKVEMQMEKDLTASKIFPHLEELKMADKVTFYQERKETAPVVKLVKPEYTLPAIAKNPGIEQPAELPKVAVAKPVAIAEKKAENPEIIIPPAAEKVVPKTETVSAPPKVVSPKKDEKLKAAIVESRKSEFTQEVIFSTDSLILSIYDNGEIDGDTISIFMNGEIILDKQGLKSSAIKKTIYLRPGTDEFKLVLFADNLGKYPPNTGLLVIRDGNDVYNLRFSADFQKNAGVLFRRKK